MVAGEEHDSLGTSSENTIKTVLFEDEAVTLELGLYNRPPDQEGAEKALGTDKFYNSQLHGDLTLTIRPGFSEISTQEFGFCVQYADNTRWDCLQAMTTVLPDKIENDAEYNSLIELVDSHYEGLDVPTDDKRLQADWGWLPGSDNQDHVLHWQNIKSKSFKRCQLDPQATV